MTNHSFAVLAYQDSRYLPACLDALARQTVPSRIYLATSTPSEYLTALARTYALPLFVNDGPGGIANDWSFAYRQCETDYLTLAHQDDIYLPDYTAQCLDAAGRSANNLMTFTDYSQLQGDTVRAWTLGRVVKKGLLLPFILKRTWTQAFIRRLVLRFGNPVCCPTVMYHKRSIGEFRFSEAYTYNLDWDAWIRLAEHEGSFAYVNKVLVHHRIHREAQTYVQTKSKRRAAEELQCLKRLMPGPIATLYARLYALGAVSNKVD